VGEWWWRLEVFAFDWRTKRHLLMMTVLYVVPMATTQYKHEFRLLMVIVVAVVVVASRTSTTYLFDVGNGKCCFINAATRLQTRFEPLFRHYMCIGIDGLGNTRRDAADQIRRHNKVCCLDISKGNGRASKSDIDQWQLLVH
jgi:hypothetical protein